MTSIELLILQNQTVIMSALTHVIAKQENAFLDGRLSDAVRRDLTQQMVRTNKEIRQHEYVPKVTVDTDHIVE